MAGLPKDETEEEITEFLNSNNQNNLKRTSSFRSFLKQSSSLVNLGGGLKKQNSKKIENLKIEKVCKVYRLGEHSKVSKDLASLKKKRHKLNLKVLKFGALEKNRDYVKKLMKTNAKILDLITKKEKELLRLKSQMSSNNGQDYSTGISFVTFTYKKQRDDFISKWQATFLNTFILRNESFSYKGNRILVYEAPEPSDVIWENLGLGYLELKKRRWTTFLSSFLILFFSFCVILALKYTQKYSTKRNALSGSHEGGLSVYTNLLISLLISALVALINTSLHFLMKYFVSIEKHESFTEFDLSFCQKLVRFQCFNTFGIICAVHFITASNKKLIWMSGGLLYDAVFVILSTNALPLIKLLFDPLYFWKVYKRWRLNKNPGKYILLQFEANELMEGKNIDLALAFSNLTTIYFIVVFFLPIFPFGSFVLFVSTSCVYCAQKFLFSKVYKKPREVGRRIGLESIYTISFGPTVLFLGIVTFDFFLERSFNTWSFYLVLGSVVISLLMRYFMIYKYTNLTVRMDTKSGYFSKNDKNHSEKPYSKMRTKFNTEYDRENPVTSAQKTKEFLQWIKSKFLKINFQKMD